MMTDAQAVGFQSGHVVLRKDKEATARHKAEAVETGRAIVGALKGLTDKRGQPVFARAGVITGENGYPDHFTARTTDGFDFQINYAGGAIVTKDGEPVTPTLGTVGRLEWLKGQISAVVRANYSAGGI